MSVNSRLQTIQIINQRQKVLESSSARKKTVDIDILVTSRNNDRKIMQSINNKQTSLKKKEVEPAEPVLRNIYQSNTYRKNLSWSHFDDEPRVQEKQFIFVFEEKVNPSILKDDFSSTTDSSIFTSINHCY